ncbi:cation-translocating P-type ATPase [Candidatus Pacearchaeota archaeon]|nr:cation-translocating P-type ATPase [Candidatus Pacearchaeota archaeon]
MDWHALSSKEVVERLDTSTKGLEKEKAGEKLNEYGLNRIKKTRKFSALKVLFDQFKSFLIIILILAAIVLFFIDSQIDAIVIMGIVILNALLGFSQEYKADRAIEQLKKMMTPVAKVMRGGKVMKINSEQIVPGDILILEEGDKIVADARVLVSDGLKVNESALTGESVSQAKHCSRLGLSLALADRINMVYQGTQVVEGGAEVVVVSTGMQTELGKISGLVQEIKAEKNPFKDNLDRFAKKVGIFILILAAGIISLMMFKQSAELVEAFLVGVSLAVSAIPEGLPAVISLGLVFATKRMIKKNVLVRKLPASETLGRVTVICTDKTGTLTEEEMKVTRIYANGKDNPVKGKDLLLKIGVLCNKARLEKDDSGNEYTLGDPTEIALVLSAKDSFLDKAQLEKQESKIKEFPFNSERKMMSVVRRSKGKVISYVKGAPERVIERCSYELINGKKVKLNDASIKRITGKYEDMAKQGLRVLGFAYKKLSSDKNLSQDLAENKLVFVGFQGMIDPPRKEVKNSIKLCKRAGIKVLMITGDSNLTANAVAKQIGLTGESVDSIELQNMSDKDLLSRIDKISVFSRISPKDKLRIIDILKQKKEIVAMTGDGVNDALALKRADIGIAMGIRGTDVARDSSDIILLDDNFASIVEGVKEGRRIYDNIKKFIKYLFSANFYEVFLVAIAILIGYPLPLLPLQILWINLATDSFPALSLSAEELEKDAMKRKPRKGSLLARTGGFIMLAGIVGLIITLIMFLTTYDKANPDSLARAQTITLTTSVIYQMFLVINCKSKKFFFKSKFNKYLFYSIVGVIIAQFVVIYYGPVAALFSFVPLTLVEWGKIVGITFAAFVFIELTKPILKGAHK